MEYRGYTIQLTDDPWAIKFGCVVEYFRDEHLYFAHTKEEAMIEIDDRIVDQERMEKRDDSLFQSFNIKF